MKKKQLKTKDESQNFIDNVREQLMNLEAEKNQIEFLLQKKQEELDSTTKIVIYI